MIDEVVKSYYFFCTILVIKLMFMSAYTGLTRIVKGVFINPEDAAVMKKKISTSEDVERIRRAHLNDLENILPFFASAFFYCATSPNAYFANLLFKIFTLSRIAHTFFYAIKPMQPARGIAWGIGYFINGYMAFTSMLHFME